MIVYISGKITNNSNYIQDFDRAEEILKATGYTVINPTKIVSSHLEYRMQMDICFELIKMVDIVYLMSNWHDSNGCKEEVIFAIKNGKKIIFEDLEDMKTDETKNSIVVKKLYNIFGKYASDNVNDYLIKVKQYMNEMLANASILDYTINVLSDKETIISVCWITKDVKLEMVTHVL